MNRPPGAKDRWFWKHERIWKCTGQFIKVIEPVDDSTTLQSSDMSDMEELKPHEANSATMEESKHEIGVAAMQEHKQDEDPAAIEESKIEVFSS